MKLLLPSIFKSVDFWSSMSSIDPDNDLADMNVFVELGFSADGNVHEYSIRPPKKYKATKQALWWTKNIHRNVWNSGVFYYNELPNVLAIDVKSENIAKRTKKCKVFGNLMEK